MKKATLNLNYPKTCKTHQLSRLPQYDNGNRVQKPGGVLKRNFGRPGKNHEESLRQSIRHVLNYQQRVKR